MMTVHLRVGLPDRPGSLARLSRLLADSGASVVRIDVVAREAGRAVDDLMLDWPPGRQLDELRALVSGDPSLQVIGLRQARLSARARPVELLRQVAGERRRSIETLVDGLPSATLADWAALLAVGPSGELGEVVHRSSAAPETLPQPAGRTLRPRTLDSDGSCAALPFGDAALILLGRAEGPPFLRTELADIAQLLAAAGLIGDLPAAGSDWVRATGDDASPACAARSG